MEYFALFTIPISDHKKPRSWLEKILNEISIIIFLIVYK